MDASSAPPSTIPPRPLAPWSTGLFNCCDDIGICCLTCWCPCLTFGRIAEIVDRGGPRWQVSAALYQMIMCMTGCVCVYSFFYRAKMREQFHLQGHPCAALCVHCWCESCALCQEYRQLQILGIDPSLGWDVYMKQQQQQQQQQQREAGRIDMAPPIQEGMNR